MGTGCLKIESGLLRVEPGVRGYQPGLSRCSKMRCRHVEMFDGKMPHQKNRRRMWEVSPGRSPSIRLREAQENQRNSWKFRAYRSNLAFGERCRVTGRARAETARGMLRKILDECPARHLRDDGNLWAIHATGVFPRRRLSNNLCRAPFVEPSFFSYCV